MLSVIPGGYRSLDDLVDATVPDKIKLDKVRAGLCRTDRRFASLVILVFQTSLDKSNLAVDLRRCSTASAELAAVRS
jgi:hypothetical protein